MIRRILAFLVGAVCAFFAYCTSTGAFQADRSLGWTLFYGMTAALMFSVVLHGPIVHVWVNTSRFRRKR